MERKIKSEGVSKVSVSKFKDYFSEQGFGSSDFVISPVVRFKTMTGGPRTIEGITIGVICNGTAKAVINDRAFESRGDELMRKFIAELSVSCERERSVEYYAKQLGITPKYLSLICKKKVGKNASKVIDGAVVNKAKELLTQSGLSIQEVSERLNFVSQSFFGKYFKQRTGISTSRYKVQG